MNGKQSESQISPLRSASEKESRLTRIDCMDEERPDDYSYRDSKFSPNVNESNVLYKNGEELHRSLWPGEVQKSRINSLLEFEQPCAKRRKEDLVEREINASKEKINQSCDSQQYSDKLQECEEIQLFERCPNECSIISIADSCKSAFSWSGGDIVSDYCSSSGTMQGCAHVKSQSAPQSDPKFSSKSLVSFLTRPLAFVQSSAFISIFQDTSSSESLFVLPSSG